MKKLLLVSVISVLALVANAENRKWNFTNWSTATVDNLMAKTDWTDIEKTDQAEPTEKSKNNCFWEVGAAGTEAGVELTANGQPIAELKGLLYTNTTARSLAIAVNYLEPDAAASFGPYHGASYLWFGGSKKNYFVIPHVKAGATIKMGVESHKNTDARGVKLYVGHGTNGTQLKSPDGEDVAAPTVYTDQEWMVPTDLTDAPNEDGTYDIQIYNTNGCHLYYIEVDEGDPTVEGTPIAYVYDSSFPGYTGLTKSILDGPLSMVITDATVTDIDLSGDVSAITRETLEGYSVVVVDGAIAPTHPFAQNLKEAISYTPMLNLNAGLYDTWGYGKATTTSTGTAFVAEADRTNDLFAPNDLGGEGVLEDGSLKLYDTGITGVTLAEDGIFAKDKVLATAGDATAIHIHNANRNAYIMLPYAANIDAPDNNIALLIPNAVKMLNKTKIAVSGAAKPTIDLTYRNQYTIVTLDCSTPNHTIYYTLDGTDPTAESTLYTEPFEVRDANVTVKAIATAEGYNLGNISEKTVGIYSVTGAPTISVAKESGKTTITLTPANESDVIYYNFRGSNDTVSCSHYTEPIEVTKHVNITAFAGQFDEDGTFLPSESATAFVDVNDEKVRLDVIGHFDNNSTDWGSLKIAAYAYYTDEIIGTEEGTDDEGNPITTNIYKPADDLRIVNPGNGWEFKTYGQMGQNTNASITHNVLDFNGYNPQTAWDDIDAENGPTNNALQFSKVSTNVDGVKDPASACIQSTTYYQAPLDVVTYAGGYNGVAEVYVSADTTKADSWVKIGDITGGTIKGAGSNGKDGSSRIWRMNIASYEGTDLVAVKVAAVNSGTVNIFDIYVKNQGEKSNEYLTGIKDVNTNAEAAGEVVRTMIYSINGAQLDKAVKGINIIKEIYANGAVKTRKVMIK